MEAIKQNFAELLVIAVLLAGPGAYLAVVILHVTGGR